MRELSAMLKQIDKRIDNDFCGQAALQGIKMPTRDEMSDEPLPDLSMDEEKLMSKALEDARLRKVSRG